MTEDELAFISKVLRRELSFYNSMSRNDQDAISTTIMAFKREKRIRNLNAKELALLLDAIKRAKYNVLRTISCEKDPQKISLLRNDSITCSAIISKLSDMLAAK